MAVVQTFLTRMVVLGLNVLTGILTARFLGPAGRAEQAALLIGVTLLPFVLSFGIPIAVQYKLRTMPEQQERLISSATLLSFALGIIAAGLALVILPHLIEKYPPAVIHLAQILMLIAPFTILYTVYCGILQARSQFSEANFTRYAMPLTTLITLVALIVAHKLTALTSALAYVMPYVWIAPWLWFKIKPKVSLRGLLESAKTLLSYGSRSYITDILGTLMSQVDQVLVIGLLSPVSMGIYAVAISAARVSDVFSGPIVLVLFPKASALPTQQIVDLTSRTARLAVVLLGATAIAIIIAMPLLIPMFYGKSFNSATGVAQILVVSFAINGVIYVLSQAFMASGRPGVMAAIQLLGLATTVPAMLLLIPRYALIGAATALIISSCLRLTMALACFPIILKSSVPSLLATRDDFRFLVFTLRSRLTNAVAD
jgi:O-antigen/teichoic acid export membrane protein